MSVKKADIPQYDLSNFRPLHRREAVSSSFGYNALDKTKFIPDFELYSSVGLVGAVGPLRSEFYRISITVSGTVDMQIGLEQFSLQPRTIGFTVPHQIFQKSNISKDAFGYYMLFKATFLQDLLPPVRLPEEFPFFGLSGTPLFQVSEDELNRIIGIVQKMDEEIQLSRPGKVKAIQLYLYLLLLEAKRSYERQQLNTCMPVSAGDNLVSRYYRLVAIHYLSKRQVSDYAQLLGVSANHLNKMVKEITGRTASDCIREMLVQEAKLLLRYTDNSISEIAYKLEFSDPASFNRFFKAIVNETPLSWRKMHS